MPLPARVAFAVVPAPLARAGLVLGRRAAAAAVRGAPPASPPRPRAHARAPPPQPSAALFRLSLFACRRRNSGAHLALPAAARAMARLPVLERDALWNVMRCVPGFLLWAAFAACVVLPSQFPSGMAWLGVACRAQTFVTMILSFFFTLLACWRIEWALMHPPVIPPQSAAADVLHVIAICRATEPADVIEDALRSLAAHPRAKRAYVVQLCLEARDPGAAAFGRAMAARFAGGFLRLLVALHPAGRADEVPGKSANVNWGVRAAAAALAADAALGGPRAVDRAVVTVCDCDAKVGAQYFDELALRFAASVAEGRPVFWAPPALFDEAAADEAAAAAAAAAGARPLTPRGPSLLAAITGGVIPGPVRVADTLWSMFALQALAGDNWVRVPVSTYSAGLRLVESAGFWDVGVESVPEDFHMALKLYWATGARARCEVIYRPVLYQHVDGGGFLTTLRERFFQVRARRGRGRRWMPARGPRRVLPPCSQPPRPPPPLSPGPPPHVGRDRLGVRAVDVGARAVAAAVGQAAAGADGHRHAHVAADHVSHIRHRLCRGVVAVAGLLRDARGRLRPRSAKLPRLCLLLDRPGHGRHLRVVHGRNRRRVPPRRLARRGAHAALGGRHRSRRLRRRGGGGGGGGDVAGWRAQGRGRGACAARARARRAGKHV
jgi:hypothetical protein